MQIKKQHLELDTEQMDWVKIGKRVWQGCTFHPAYLTYRQSTYCKLPAWVSHKLECNLGYAGNTTLMAESKEELKSLLMRVKEKSEKSGLKLNIQNTKIMASGKERREKWKQWEIFFFLGSKITADGDCSMKLKDTCSWQGNLWQT